MEGSDRSLVSINGACEIAGVSRRTIYTWMAHGKVEYVRTAGGSIRIYRDTLLRPDNAADEARRATFAGNARTIGASESVR